MFFNIFTAPGFAVLVSILPFFSGDAVGAGADVGPSVDLEQAISSAWENTENKRVSESLVRQSDEALKQATGALYPTLSLQGSYLYQSVPSDLAASQSIKSDQEIVKLNLAQPLFHGGREWALLNQTSLANEASQFDNLERQRLVNLQVIDVFFNQLTSEKDLFDLQELLKLSENRTGEVKSRVKIGRSRNSELLAAQAQFETTRAQYILAESNLRDARNAFAIVTGLNEGTKINDSVKWIEPPANADFTRAVLEERADFKSRKLKIDQADEGIKIARGGHWPQLDLAGNYYFERTGQMQPVKWDAGLILTIPLFQGGVVSSQVRSATETMVQLRLLYEQALRTAEADVHHFFLGWKSSADAYKSFESAATASEKNLKEAQREYRLGLVTNLEVLQTLNSLIDVTRQRDHTFYQAKQNYARFQNAVGKLR